MADVAFSLYIQTMQTAIALAMPAVFVVGSVGVVVSLAQTVVGIQDQNISFGPKVVALAVMLAAGASTAVALLEHLVLVAIAALPRVIG